MLLLSGVVSTLVAARVPPLTNTAYAILGLLSIRPHTAYDLTQQARRGLAFVWPIAESQLYAEPKRLAREGLVSVTEEPAGPQRTRRVYAITAKGRRALRAWLDTPPPPEPWQSEIVLRVLFADAGDRGALLRSLEATRASTLAQYEAGAALVAQNLAGDEPYPGRLGLNAVWWTLVAERLRLTLAWVDVAIAEVTAWGEGPPSEDRARALAERMLAGRAVVPPLPAGPPGASAVGPSRRPATRRR